MLTLPESTRPFESNTEPILEAGVNHPSGPERFFRSGVMSMMERLLS